MTITAAPVTDILTELRRQEAEILKDPDFKGCRMCEAELSEIRRQIEEIEDKTSPVLPEGKKLYRLRSAGGAEEFATNPQILRDHITGMVARTGYFDLRVDFEQGAIVSGFTGTTFMNFTIEEV
ncbi:hypothetical protein SEA_ZIMMER_84 [Mycobacterium phage Zimmer]|nr:hypothetical protein SEA_ZIMMER_84 [Mycobacterium phage Zimmer]